MGKFNIGSYGDIQHWLLWRYLTLALTGKFNIALMEIFNIGSYGEI